VGKEFELADMNVVMIRIYLRRTFKSSNEFESMKNSILKCTEEEIKELNRYSR
jgi:uncharacterized protein